MSRLRKRNSGGGASSERWLVTYADLITLLFVFFVVLWSISNADLEKFQQLSQSMQQAFRTQPVPLSDGGGTRAVLEEDPRFMAYLSVRAQVQGIVGRHGLHVDDATVDFHPEGIVIRLADGVLFPPGEVQLRPSAYPILEDVAAIIGPLPNQIRIEGHTDNVAPVDSRYPDNWVLSSLRAVNTVRYLADVQGVPAGRLAAVGHAEFRPLGDNTTLEGRRMNRRVEFVIVQPQVGT